MTSVIGDAGLGALHITSDLTAEQLVEIIDELTPTAANGLPETASATVDTVAGLMTEVSTDTIAATAATAATAETAATAATAGASRPGAQCGVLGSGLDLMDS